MAVFDDIAKIVNDNLQGERERIETDPRTWVHGCLRQRERIAAVAEYCAQHWSGDFVEIGCLHGGTTRHLAPIARRHSRRIVCVDPWPSKCPLTNTDYGPDPYGQFITTMADWIDLLDILKTKSQEPATIAYIQTRPLCFAFVDGMHTYECASADIATVAHCVGVVCVDDILWEPGVKQAFWESALKLQRMGLENNLCREGWLVPK